MDPQSVYNDTWAPLTWALVLAAMIVFVLALMLTLIAMIHRAGQLTGAAAGHVGTDPLADVGADAVALNAPAAAPTSHVSAA